MGRHLKYTDPEVLQEKINEYFTMCDTLNKPYTMYGLANTLDIDRRTLLNYSYSTYSEVGEKFFPAISRARDKCREYAESRLFDRDGANGAKFYLINNAKEDGWSDRQDVSLEASGFVQFVDLPKPKDTEEE